MKAKHLGFMEKNLEKIVIGIAGTILVAVLWFFVLGSPHKVEYREGMGAPRVVIPGQVEQALDDKAIELQAGLIRGDSPLPPISVPAYRARFSEGLTETLAQDSALAVALGEPGLDQALVTDAGGVAGWPRYDVPLPSAPAQAMARADFAVMGEVTDERLSGQYLKLIGNRQPRDFFYVSVAGTYNLQNWFGELRQTRIPEDWWRQQRLLTYVVLERQTLDKATGQWSEATVITPLPGTPRKVDYLPSDADGERAVEVLNEVRENQSRITEWEFPPITGDRPWLPPGVDLDKLSREHKQLLNAILVEIALVKRQMDLIRAQQTNTAQPQEVNPETGQPFEGMPQDMMMPDGNTISGDLPQLEQRLQELYQDRDATLRGEEVNSLRNVDPGTATPRFGAPGPNEQPRPRRAPRGPMELLAHDLTAVPGQTYRYRFVVGVFNPLFRRGQVQEEQRLEMFNRLSLASKPGPWSEPVIVPPDTYFFLAGVNTNQRLARFDVWQVFNGQRVRETVDVRLGDIVSKTTTRKLAERDVSVTFSAPVLLVDIFGSPAGMSGSSRVILWDLNTNTIFERNLSSDSNDPIAIQLRQQESLLKPKTPTVTPENPEMMPPEMQEGFQPGGPPGYSPRDMPPGSGGRPAGR